MPGTRVRFGGSSNRRVFAWSGVVVRTEIQALAEAQSLGDVSLGVTFGARPTLTRVRGNWAGHMVPAAASDSMIVGLGLIVVSTDAFVAGAASVPSPLEDLNAEWVWHQLIVFSPSQTTETQTALDQYDRGSIDSKAMRKMNEAEVLGFVWDGLRLAGSPTFDGIAAIRPAVLLG